MKKSSLLAAILLFSLSLPIFALGIGDFAKVEWKGEWYDANIIDQSGIQFRIHYRGYDNTWDEWVSPQRMRLQVLWKGQWYHAKALRISDQRVLIHYNGYSSDWDEWVSLDRIRSR
jgi:hypothetical protein